MKIISINAQHTKSQHDVAFNVDIPPAAGVMEKISYGNLRIRFQDGLLFVRANQDDPGISERVVNNLNVKISEAERLVAAEIAEQAHKHAAIIESVSKLTGLPVQ
jgi:hypothetical protein